ncbi:MAG: hypothetical protein JJ975_00800 [Bacteroidia bacterium]|nr:hypothetical protein [Bacteroidia bacterium]
MKRILNYVIYANLVVATSAFVLSVGVGEVVGISNSLGYGLFSSLSTFFVYNGQRLFKISSESSGPRLNWVFKNRKFLWVASMASAVLALLCFVCLVNRVNLTVVLIMCVSLVISILYVIPLGNKSLREISYAKTHAIALTWTLVIVVFPLINENVCSTKLFLSFVPAHYLYFLAVAVVFDINDLKVDPLSQRTIPQIVGTKYTKKVACALLLLSMIGITYYTFSSLSLGAVLIQIILIAGISDRRGNIYFDLYIDGAVSLLGLSYIFCSW